MRNLRHFGYGVKGFVLSMIETAIEMTGGRLEAADVQTIIGWGRDMLDSPVEPRRRPGGSRGASRRHSG